jgi:hypothetical protein
MTRAIVTKQINTINQWQREVTRLGLCYHNQGKQIGSWVAKPWLDQGWFGAQGIEGLRAFWGVGAVKVGRSLQRKLYALSADAK